MKKDKGIRTFVLVTILLLICLLVFIPAFNALIKSRTDRNAEADTGSCGTAYEIFVSSFCDSDGDGTGDLNGISSKLDYIAELGFDGIWLTPVQPSATYHRYDVDDYCAIDPELGSMEDYEALLDQCHERGIKVYMDLVLNHTSDDHPWFRAASDYLHELPWDWEPDPSYCKYFEYYNFRSDPADGYTQLEGTGWYYEARHWSEMPDLNLANDAVRGEIKDIMSFWLGKGVDGFRLDAVTSFFTDDTDANTDFLRFLTETAKSIDPDCYMVGEAWIDGETISSLYRSGIDSLFDFPFSGSEGVIARTVRGESSAEEYVDEMIRSETAYREANPGCIPAPFYTNHDMDRSAEYYPYDDSADIKTAYAMNLFMTGNAFVYYGEEIGMNGAGKDENRRAPMYWSDDAGDPDMCTGPEYMDDVQMKLPSLKEQMMDEHSVYSWFADVIRIRKKYPAVSVGVTEKADFACDDDIASFFRKSDICGNVLIVMNIHENAKEVDMSKLGGSCKMTDSLSADGEKVEFNDAKLLMPGHSLAIFSG